MNFDTHFAPAQRSLPEDILDEHQFIVSQKHFSEIFDVMNGVSAIIDSNRQIVYLNSAFLALLGESSMESILGKRPGEVIACVHSVEEYYGCGTADACRYCGAVNAILESQQTGRKTKRETRISTSVNGKLICWDLNVTSTPVLLSGKTFYILSLQDISSEKRKAALERIFFHDLLNSVGGLHGILLMLKKGVDAKQEAEIINISEEASRDILEEIFLHKQLREAENGDLQVSIEPVNSSMILNASTCRICSYSIGKNKQVVFDSSSPVLIFDTDRILFQRVIINLLKNALEATPENGTVSLGVEDLGDNIRFWVKNDELMPPEVQAQLFQRSFSTKGIDRGIGTYSIKLLIETYLKGKVSFLSNEHDRTVFSIELSKKWPQTDPQ